MSKFPVKVEKGQVSISHPYVTTPTDSGCVDFAGEGQTRIYSSGSPVERESRGEVAMRRYSFRKSMRDKEREEVSMKEYEEGGEMDGVKAKARQIEYKKKKKDLNPFVSLTQE